MQRNIKKYVKQHWPELSVLVFFAAFLLAYFLYLKVAVRKELIHFEIQVLSQEREELFLRDLIAELKIGDTNPNGRLVLEEIKYFSGLKKEWMIDNDYVRGKMRFSYLSDNKRGLYYYGDQELKVGQEKIGRES